MSRLIEAWSSRPITELEISDAMWILLIVLSILVLLAPRRRRPPEHPLELRAALERVDLLRARVIILRSPHVLSSEAQVRIREDLRRALPEWWFDRGGRVAILEEEMDVEAILEAPPGAGS